MGYLEGVFIKEDVYGTSLQREIIAEYKVLFGKRFGSRWTDFKDETWVSSIERDLLLTEAGQIIQKRRREQA